ncbi:odorant receptor 94b-like [Zophobas morio]|uniref:odorant receptor 94b-like n=1 Tax=Zophobas morio TaxID=2755281 RepID=UPI0030830DB0
MTNLIKDSFNIIIFALRFIGLYYDDKQTKLAKIWSYVLYLWCASVSTLAFVGFVKEKTNDIRQTNQMLVFLASSIAVCLKVFLVLMSGPEMRKCIEYFGDDYFAPKNKEDELVLENCRRICKRTFRVYATVLLFAAISWNTLPLFDKKARFPVDIWLPYEPKKGTAVYFMTYVYVAVVIVYLGLVTTLLEPLLGGLAYHAVSQLKILEHDLLNVGKRKLYLQRNTYLKSCSQNLCEAVKQCIVHYDSILTFVKKYEDCFSWCTFCQITGTTLSLGFCCIGLTLVSPTSMNAVLFFVSYLAVAAQIFFYCHYGTILYEEHEKIMKAIYMSPWHEYDVKTRKMLIIVMERSKSPVILTAGKIIQLTYQTFISVLKTSYSFIAIMNNLN